MEPPTGATFVVTGTSWKTTERKSRIVAISATVTVLVFFILIIIIIILHYYKRRGSRSPNGRASQLSQSQV